MKQVLFFLLLLFLSFISGCSNPNDPQVLRAALSSAYPPFEYREHGELKGFDVDLATLIAKELGKKVAFIDMQFSSILPALHSNEVDVAISTITITEERKKQFDFSIPYYFEGLAAVFKETHPIHTLSECKEKKIAVQLGSTMEIWLKKNLPQSSIVSFNNNNQATEALKAGYVDMVLMDAPQGAIFSRKNAGVGFAMIAESPDGFGIAFKKNDPLKAQINAALQSLNNKGALKSLEQKWLSNK